MLSGIGDIQAALKLVRKMRVEADEVLRVCRKMVSKGESLFSPEDFERLKSVATGVESEFVRDLGAPAESSADLLTQIDQLCAATSLYSLCKSLDELYEQFSTMGADTKKVENLKAMSERVNKIRMAQQSVDQLRAAGVPPELLAQVSQSLNPCSADKIDAYLEAQLVMNEAGHLGDRLTKFVELMERSGVSSFGEKQKEWVGKVFAFVDSIYELLSCMELLRDTSEALNETIKIDALRALQAQAHRIRDGHLKLIAAGDALDVEARLGEFIVISNLPAKT